MTIILKYSVPVYVYIDLETKLVLRTCVDDEAIDDSAILGSERQTPAGLEPASAEETLTASIIYGDADDYPGWEFGF